MSVTVRSRETASGASPAAEDPASGNTIQLLAGLGILVAQRNHEDPARPVGQDVLELPEQLLAQGDAERPTVGAVLDVLEAVVAARLCDPEPRAVIFDVVDHERLELLSPHHLKENGR